MARPVLKWAGGKRRLRFEIERLMPVDYLNRGYHEPFFGGGAIFFHLEPKSGSINDVNERLMMFYRVVKNSPRELIEEVSRYEYSKDQYYECRRIFNEEKLSPIEEAAILLYMNKTGYNGLYRVNSKGKYNVPFGRFKNPTIMHEDRIMKASELFSRVEIYSERFTYVKEVVEEGDVVYFDPPYLPEEDVLGFTAYSTKGFGLKDHLELMSLCKELDDNGVLFIQSNNHVPLVVEACEEYGFKTHVVNVSRAINSVISNRGRISEVLITNIIPV
jgi:DNA adenine methylase